MKWGLIHAASGALRFRGWPSFPRSIGGAFYAASGAPIYIPVVLTSSSLLPVVGSHSLWKSHNELLSPPNERGIGGEPIAACGLGNRNAASGAARAVATVEKKAQKEGGRSSSCELGPETLV